jgi:hypothetical protein
VGGFALASHGAAAALQAPRARGLDPTWPSSPTAAPTGFPDAGPGVPVSGVGGGALGGGLAMPSGARRIGRFCCWRGQGESEEFDVVFNYFFFCKVGGDY